MSNAVKYVKVGRVLDKRLRTMYSLPQQRLLKEDPMKLFTLLLCTALSLPISAGPASAAKAFTKAVAASFAPAADLFRRYPDGGAQLVGHIADLLDIPRQASARRFIRTLESLPLTGTEAQQRDIFLKSLTNPDSDDEQFLYYLSEVSRIAYLHGRGDHRFSGPLFPVPQYLRITDPILPRDEFLSFSDTVGYIHDILKKIPPERSGLTTFLEGRLSHIFMPGEINQEMDRLSLLKLRSWALLYKIAELDVSENRRGAIARGILKLYTIVRAKDIFHPENESSLFTLAIERSDRWDELGGLDHILSVLEEAALYRLDYPESTVTQALEAVADDAQGDDYGRSITDFIETRGRRGEPK